MRRPPPSLPPSLAELLARLPRPAFLPCFHPHYRRTQDNRKLLKYRSDSRLKSDAPIDLQPNRCSRTSNSDDVNHPAYTSTSPTNEDLQAKFLAHLPSLGFRGLIQVLFGLAELGFTQPCFLDEVCEYLIEEQSELEVGSWWDGVTANELGLLLRALARHNYMSQPLLERIFLSLASQANHLSYEDFFTVVVSCGQMGVGPPQPLLDTLITALPPEIAECSGSSLAAFMNTLATSGCSLLTTAGFSKIWRATRNRLSSPSMQTSLSSLQICRIMQSATHVCKAASLPTFCFHADAEWFSAPPRSGVNRNSSSGSSSRDDSSSSPTTRSSTTSAITNATTVTAASTPAIAAMSRFLSVTSKNAPSTFSLRSGKCLARSAKELMIILTPTLLRKCENLPVQRLYSLAISMRGMWPNADLKEGVLFELGKNLHHLQPREVITFATVACEAFQKNENEFQGKGKGGKTYEPCGLLTEKSTTVKSGGSSGVCEVNDDGLNDEDPFVVLDTTTTTTTTFESLLSLIIKYVNQKVHMFSKQELRELDDVYRQNTNYVSEGGSSYYCPDWCESHRCRRWSY